MPRSPRSRKPLPPPAFDPVPVRVRHDGWHPDKQRAFIAVLAATRRLDRAAEAVGMSRESAYYLRRHRGGKSFAAAWDEIMDRPRGRPSSREGGPDGTI